MLLPRAKPLSSLQVPGARELCPQEPGDLCHMSTYLFVIQRPFAQVMGKDTLCAASDKREKVGTSRMAVVCWTRSALPVTQAAKCA